MRVLSVNAGSSSLKFDVLRAEAGTAVQHEARGIVERIGPDAAASLEIDGKRLERSAAAADHAGAFGVAMQLLEKAGLASSVEAVGHRVVHGGGRFRAPLLIDADVLAGIQDVTRLAPLHNGAALEVIHAARARLHAVPMVATFDTAFFASLPEVAVTYALPRDVRESHGIRRYGFHGLAHRYMIERFRLLNPSITRPRLISLQLGSGCSVTASRDGQPIDTSMGFTPLEGLIMGTRSGDLDPSIPLYLANSGLPLEEVELLLNKQSGLLALSGVSHDMREVVKAAASGHQDSRLAVDAFCYRARKYIGAYAAVLGGVDAIAFGGGIGENSPEVRERICNGLAWAGIELDLDLNRARLDRDARVSPDPTGVDVWVIRVDESEVIATDVLRCLGEER